MSMELHGLIKRSFTRLLTDIFVCAEVPPSFLKPWVILCVFFMNERIQPDGGLIPGKKAFSFLNLNTGRVAKPYNRNTEPAVRTSFVWNQQRAEINTRQDFLFFLLSTFVYTNVKETEGC